MIEVMITSDILEEAKKEMKNITLVLVTLEHIRTNKQRQRMTGYLAEACIRYTFPEIKYSDDYFVDFILDSSTIDSKAQGCNSKPLDFYSATLYEEQKIEIQTIIYLVELKMILQLLGYVE